MMRWTIMAVALLAALISGCASQGTRVPTDVEAVRTHAFNPTDLQLIAQKAVSDLMARDLFNNRETRPFVYVSKVRNLTNEHINSDLIAESVAVQLSNTGKVRLSGVPKELDEAIRALEFQRGPYVDPTTARQIGRMVGAEYFVQGELGNLESRAGRVKGQFFQFTLTLVDIQTLEVWKSQVQIQKVSKRGLFGW